MVRNAVRQIAHYTDSGPLWAKLLKNGALKTHKCFRHGTPTTESATINADLLAFIRGLQPPLREFRSHITEKENPDASRVSVSDADVQHEVLTFHRGTKSPVVSHFLALDARVR